MPRLNPPADPTDQAPANAGPAGGAAAWSAAPASALPAGWRLWPRRVLQWPVRAYRLLLSPSLGSACRFWPTCSAYALDALERHGALRGSGLTLWRIARCHPWCAGGHDPVPDLPPPSLFTGLLSAARRPLPPSRKKSP